MRYCSWFVKIEVPKTLIEKKPLTIPKLNITSFVG